MCSGWVQASKTRRRGASRTRVMTRSRSTAFAEALVLSLLAAMLLLLHFQLSDIVVQTLEALFPEAAIALDPIRHLFERTRIEPAGPPLRVAAPRDEARVLEDLEVLRDGGHADVEGLGQLRDRGHAPREASQNRP